MSVLSRSEVEFGGTVYKSAPDVAPTWEIGAARGGFCAAAASHSWQAPSTAWRREGRGF